MKPKLTVIIRYYNYKWYRGKLILDKRKLVREKIICKSISCENRRFCFNEGGWSTNINSEQIKKLTIEQKI